MCAPQNAAYFLGFSAGCRIRETTLSGASRVIKIAEDYAMPGHFRVGSLWLLACAATHAQTTIRTDVSLVQLSVRVTDSTGRNVTGLPREAFHLTVDGREHPITVFSGEDAPVTAGIVVDNSASMFPKKEEVATAALAFARGSNPRDEMFVVHFNQQPRLGIPAGKAFTGDIGELESAISRMQVGGSTALYDAILLGQSQLQRAGSSVHVLLVISDGGDNSSKATLEETVDAVSKSGTVLYLIGIFDENNRDRNPQVLSRLASISGGQVFLPNAVSEITGICKHIAAEIRRQYTLGFAGAEDGAYHQIGITITDPLHRSLQAHTRPGYFGARPRGSDEVMQRDALPFRNTDSRSGQRQRPDWDWIAYCAGGRHTVPTLRGGQLESLRPMRKSVAPKRHISCSNKTPRSYTG
jgi:VWFA-related protein